MGGQARYTNWGLFALLIVFLAGGLPARAQYGGGAGTAENPYLIETAEQMNAIGLNPAAWDKHFRLIANIDMKDLGKTEIHLVPVFLGVFDGGGHTIANLTYVITNDDSPPESDFVRGIGLFRGIQGASAVVKNLGLVNPNLRLDSDCRKRVEGVGVLAGRSEGSIQNCYVKGGWVNGDESVGGLVGQNYGSISDSWSSAEVWGEGDAGGLVGECERLSSVSRCHAKGKVAGRSNVGGLIGTCEKECYVTDCFTGGSVVAPKHAGGLIGWSEGEIARCYSTALVCGNADVGGLVGCNTGTIRTSWTGGYAAGGTVGGLVGLNWKYDDYLTHYDPIVTDSYARGNVVGADIVGGLIGQNSGGAVVRCYSVGAVTGLTQDSLAGGLVGANDGIPMWDCFWDIAVSGLAESDGGIGKTTIEMQDMGLYIAAGWDFEGEAVNGVDDVWKMLPGAPSYPRLAWEQAPAEDDVAPTDVKK